MNQTYEYRRRASRADHARLDGLNAVTPGRVDRAYKAFFRRGKEGGKPGVPREV